MKNELEERKQAEESLRESEKRYRSIFENVQDVYYEESIDGTILDFSPSIGIMSKGQYRRDDLIGKSMYEFYSEPIERQYLLAALQERGAVMDFEITLKNRDGSRIPCSISSKICLDVEGGALKVLIIAFRMFFSSLKNPLRLIMADRILHRLLYWDK